MTWLVELLSWIILSTGFMMSPVTGYQDQVQNYLLTENYIERTDKLQWIRYARWWDLRWRYTDCWWLFVRFWINNWLWDDDFWSHNNSFKIWKKWNVKKDFDEVGRWDFLFFDSKNGYHIAMATTWFDWRYLWIIDFVRWDSPEIRDIRLYRCRWWFNNSYCYRTKKWTRRVYAATNWFVEVAKEKDIVLDETKEILNILSKKQHEMRIEDIKNSTVDTIVRGFLFRDINKI